MTTPDGTPATLDPGSAYRLVRARIADLLGGAEPAAAERPVPGCPDWTVRETLSHLVGACSDILSGSADSAGSAEWTAAQVAARRGEPVAALLEEWSVTGERVAERLAGRSALGQVVMDAVSHEYDLREALDVPAPGDDPVLGIALGWLTPRFGRFLDATGVASLRLVITDGSDGTEQILGSGAPAATLRTTRLLALRMLTGRLPRSTVRALDWDADPGPWLAALSWGPFRPAA